MILEVEKFQSNKNKGTLEDITEKIIKKIEQYDKSLLDIRPTPAEIIIKAYEGDYDIRDYVADIVQFLSCKEVVNVLHNIH